MYLESKTTYLIKLKTILQSSYLYIFILIVSLLYFVYNTLFITYNSKYSSETFFQGNIINYKIDGNKLSITFKDKELLIANYYFKTEDEKKYYEENIKYGSFIKIEGLLKEANNNTILNTFNYKKYLYSKRIYKLIDINKINIDNSNISLLNKIKNNILSNILKSSNSSYLKAFILGDSSLIDENDYDTFKNIGITHLFAISGMHITLFSSTILFILNKLKRGKNTSIIISLIILFLYAILCNFPSSIKRAYTLYLLLSLNKIFKLDIKTIYLLLLCISINVFIEPFILKDIGFLYSISTTFGLIVSSSIIQGNFIKKLFLTSLLAYLFSMPITILNNYEINLMTPFNNVIIVPLVSLIIYPLSLLSFIFPILNNVLNILISILLFICNILVKINVFNIIIPKLNIYFIIVYYLILLLAIFKNKKLIFLMIIIFVINDLIYCFKNDNFVYYLDVKQGDSLLIKYNNTVSLIDTGGIVSFNKEDWQKSNSNYLLTSNTILFLKSIGIKKIDNLIISHGDFDHMGETINLVNNFKVEKVIFNCGFYNDLEKELIKVLDKKRIKNNSCIKELNIDNNKLHFLQTKEYDNENDNSNVIITELNGYKFMFMGDAGIDKEKDILDKYNISDIDVLKVGHHGSKTSSSKEFINEVKPMYSIISVGKNNRYGHPSIEVLNNLEDSKIYRTDQDGSIMFKINSNKLQIEICSP